VPIKRKKHSATDTRLAAFPNDVVSTSLHVVVETPRGSRNKYAFDRARRAFTLRKVLPEGMEFPYDFGFIPSTIGEDGDPLDILIFLDAPTFPGCVVEVRLIGVLEGEKTIDGRKISDHRFVGVANESRTHSTIQDIEDLNDNLLDEVEKFFENYAQDPGHDFKVVGRRGSNEAMRFVAAGRKHRKLPEIA